MYLELIKEAWEFESLEIIGRTRPEACDSKGEVRKLELVSFKRERERRNKENMGGFHYLSIEELRPFALLSPFDPH
jgi:hypothetical protein